MSSTAESEHWETSYVTKPTNGVSWWQDPDALWYDLITDTGVGLESPIVDMGSGSSVLIDALVGAGYQHITAVDLSATALGVTRTPVGGRRVERKFRCCRCSDVPITRTGPGVA